jgi:hypothetical protein
MRRSLLAVTALVLPLAACGGGDGDEGTTIEAAGLVRNASTATADAGSAQITYEAEVSGLPEGATVDSFGMSGSGAMDFDDQTGTLSISYDDDLPGVPDGTTFDSVFAGTVTYLRSELFGELPGGAEWMRIDYQELLADQAGVDVSQLPTAGSDPSSGLAVLEGVADDGVEEVGEEEVDGVSTTRYHAEIDISDAYEDNDAITDPDAFAAFVSQFGEEDTMSMDVWLDDDGRVVQQEYEQPFPIFGPGTDTTMSVTMGFHDFGSDVDVELPDEGDTIGYAELLEAVGD